MKCSKMTKGYDGVVGPCGKDADHLRTWPGACRTQADLARGLSETFPRHLLKIAATDPGSLNVTELRVVVEEILRTNTRLNRRLGILEAGVAEKISASAGPSMGRALANAAAEMYKEKWEQERARGQRIVTTLGDALRKYGRHGLNCLGGATKRPCTCGLDRAKEDIMTPESQAPPTDPNKPNDRGHIMNGPIRDGYRECSRCGYHENEDPIIHQCLPREAQKENEDGKAER